MSLFNKVMAEHENAKTAAEHAEAAARAARTKAEADFANEFAQKVQEIATPIFEKFAADALAYGFPATTEHRADGRSNPIYAVRLRPEKGSQLGVNASDEIIYSLKGILAEQKVEHSAFFDQRRGDRGTKTGAYGLQSINQSVLERELSEFLSSALKSRAA